MTRNDAAVAVLGATLLLTCVLVLASEWDDIAHIEREGDDRAMHSLAENAPLAARTILTHGVQLERALIRRKIDGTLRREWTQPTTERALLIRGGR